MLTNSPVPPYPGRHSQPPFLVGNEWARLLSAEAQVQGSDWERGPNPAVASDRLTRFRGPSAGALGRRVRQVPSRRETWK